MRLGAVAWPRSRDVHVTPTPRWGGLAMFFGFLAGLALAFQLPALRLAFDYSQETAGIISAASVVVAVGLLDDKFDLDATTKFAGQVLAAGIMVLAGNSWSEIWLPFGGDELATGSDQIPTSGTILILGPAQSTLLTVALTVVIINSVNFIDGLDGLAAGIGAIMALSGFIFSLHLVRENGNDPSAYTPSLIQAVTLGACVGYLYHAVHPARLFMGDTGSMLIGILISAGMISASGRVPPGDEPASYPGVLAPIVVVLGVLLIPVGDLIFAIARRMLSGKSIFAPDKRHLHHRLLALGHGHRRTVMLLYAWASVLGVGSALLATELGASLILGGAAVIAIFLLTATFWPRSVRRRQTRSGGRPYGQPPG